MRALLDTHAFLWWIMNDRRVSLRAQEIIRDPESDIFVSAATVWEIAIKAQIGKLALSDDIHSLVSGQLITHGFEALSVTMEHALAVYDMPLHHRDPFDRILIAQSKVEGLVILSADAKFAEYGTETIW